ncbi:MAG: TonB-dependent receptor plug domain-containing protein, partial [Pseudomonadota bacterium]
MIRLNRAWAPHGERDRWLIALLVGAGLAGTAAPAISQDTEESDKPSVSRDDFDIAPPSQALEEVVVVGRQKVTAVDVITERLELDVVADFLDAEAISRAGDSTVSLALRRVPGLTLVNGQFVYVRGLGERYSNVLLNSAYVPSPDLTRNVLPLDIFPTIILDSLAITKTYSADLPAGFGGGSVNIRTKNVPDGPVLSFEVGTGYNSESSEDGFRALNGDDDFLGSDDGTRAFPDALSSALVDFQGDIGAANIAGSLIAEGGGLSLVEAQTQAQQINRELATSLNRDIGFDQESLGPGANLELVGGDSWILGGAERWQVGVLALGKYRRSERNRERINRGVTDPEITNSRTLRTIDRVAITGVLNTGLNFTDDHSISTTSLFLRNTEDEASLTLGNNFNFIGEDGQQFRNFDVRFEERELRGHQVRGSHTIGGDTTELLPFLDNPLTNDLKLEWFFSDTTAQTDIPSELRVSAEDQIDPVTGEVLQTNVRASGSALDYRFTNLEDDQESYGYTLSKPVFGDNYDVTFSGGYAYTRKTRNYRQLEFDLGTTNPEDVSVLQGAPEDVFTDANLLDPANQFVLSVGGIGTESYLAAQTILAGFGKVDWRYGEHWRVSAGVRYEDFQQASLPFNPFEFDVGVGQVAVPDDELDTLVFVENDVYPSLALTWSTNDFWARDFQLRFGFSQTVTRPDLREISVATFIDPLTEARVRG